MRSVEKLHGAARCELTGNLVGLNDQCEVPDPVRHYVVASRLANRLVDADSSDFDDLVHDVYGETAAAINNSGLLEQFLALFEHLGDKAIDEIVEIVTSKEERHLAETEAVVPLATRKEYDDAIASLDDAMGTPDEDPGLAKAKELLMKARDKQYPAR
jgi:hypothetical protein